MFLNANIYLKFRTLCDIISCSNLLINVSEVETMNVSYKKLWKLLIDRDLKKKDLEEMAGVSHYTMNKLTHGDNVTTDVLGRICKALNVTIDEIISVLKEGKKWQLVVQLYVFCSTLATEMLNNCRN